MNDSGNSFMGVVVAIVIVVGLVVGLAMKYTPSDVSGDAREWATEMGYVVQGVRCMDYDTDGDGYISCSVKTSESLLAIECAKGFSMNNGCRVATGKAADRGWGR